MSSTQKRRYARALPQEFHLPPQFLGDFGELNFYNKASGRRIIIYKAILSQPLDINQFNLVVMSEVLWLLINKFGKGSKGMDYLFYLLTW